MTSKLKREALWLAVCALIFGLGFVFEFHWLVYIALYLALSYKVLIEAVTNIVRGEWFDENFLMAIASLTALFLADYTEGVAVMLFYQIGEWFQSFAVGKSRQSIKSLLALRPDEATVYRQEQWQDVSPEEVLVDERVQVGPGQRIPLDGVILSGQADLDTKALTGESNVLSVSQGDMVLSGSVNLNGVLQIKVTSTFANGTVAKILKLVSEASERKSRSEAFITRFSRVYTPVVVLGAVLVALLGSLLSGDWHTWIYRACSFLVISCPCALVISVPLSFFGGIGAASRHGILVKGSNYLEQLAKVDTFLFDKTGTLTTGHFQVVETKTEAIDALVAIESYATHPLALGICQAYQTDKQAIEVKELPGLGMEGIVDGIHYYVGSIRLMESLGYLVQEQGSIVCIASDQAYLGCVILEDTVKDNASQVISQLPKSVLLSGDRYEVAKAVGDQLGINEVYAPLLPQDKLVYLEKREGLKAFVGDGMNDAPVLVGADVGIAMGALGSDAAIEAADVVLMQDDLAQLIMARKIAQKTLRIAYENIIFALGIKALILLLSVFGLTNMWAAVFADVGVSFIAILNAMRLLLEK